MVTSSIWPNARGSSLCNPEKGIEFEQNLTGRQIATVILVSKSNRLEDLLPLASACAIAISTALPGRITRVSWQALVAAFLAWRKLVDRMRVIL
jgi:hypothetical protein